MHEFLFGAKCYWRAWKLAWKEHLWHLLLIPGLIGVLYFPLIAVVTYRYGGGVARYMRDHWVPDFLKQKVYFILVAVAIWMLGLYVGFILFRNVVMILYAPALSYLSRKTEEKAVENTHFAEEDSFLAGALRGIGMSLTSLVLAIGLFCFCVVLLIIPLIGQLGMAVLLPVSQMFLAGHGFMDPTLERRHFTVAQSFRFAWGRRRRTMGCGAVFVLLTMIPIAGWFLAPTLGIVAGTLIALDSLENEKRQQ
jgi:uncharacterized protein involved in cysteine biosynthesis